MFYFCAMRRTVPDRKNPVVFLPIFQTGMFPKNTRNSWTKSVCILFYANAEWTHEAPETPSGFLHQLRQQKDAFLRAVSAPLFPALAQKREDRLP